MTRPLAALLAGMAMLAAAPSADAAVPVDIQFQAFSPTPLDVLPGETVEWTNISERRHTVTADDGSFDSGDTFGGDKFDVTFPDVGKYAYHCSVHPTMTGEVDVRRVTLGQFPTDLTPKGESVEIDGRTASPDEPVTIERSTGGDFEPVESATPNADGTWTTKVLAEKTAQYRAVLGQDVSETRRLLVSDRRVILHVKHDRISVRVVPPHPYAHVNLELRLRDRFGWWPEQRKRLNYLSQATFRVHRRVRARVALADKDGWTRLAISRVVRLRPR